MTAEKAMEMVLEEDLRTFEEKGGMEMSGKIGGCSHSGKDGHTEEACWKKHPEQSPWVSVKRGRTRARIRGIMRIPLRYKAY